MSACSDPLEDLAKENVEAITKTYPQVIIVCSDSFVGTDINGSEQVLYNGTHCWVAGGGYFPSGINAGGSEPYIPNGYPSIFTDGGGGFGTGSSWFFSMQSLKSIYSAGSTLNLAEKDQLWHVLDLISYAVPPQYMNLYATLTAKLHVLEKRIIFKIDSNGADGQYIKGGMTITFRTNDCIIFDVLSEELVHAVQHLCYYGASMNPDHKNYEFEEKVFHDLAEHLRNPSSSEYKGSNTNPNPVYAINYIDWIDSLTNLGYYPRGQDSIFNARCQEWHGPGVTTLTDFSALLLRRFFDRPIPPGN